jgi:sec-independent protein translocase protein TatB
MFNLDPGKLLVIAVVAIILLGPDRLPQVARQLGGAWRSFNEFRHRMESEVRNTMPDLPPTSEIARLARSPSALLNHLSNMSSDDPKESSDEEPDGSFQPPTLAGQNGNAGTGAEAGAATPAATNGAAAGEGHVAPPPTPAPTRADRSVRPPQSSGIVVPGDPTRN